MAVQGRGISFRNLGGLVVDSEMSEPICKGKKLPTRGKEKKGMPDKENVRSKCIDVKQGR